MATELRKLGQTGTVNLETIQTTTEAGNNSPRILFPPRRDDTSSVLWSGPLNAASFQRLVDSPARTELANRIIAGHSAVWVLIESGKPDADNAIARRIEERIKVLETEADLPPIDPDDPTSILGPGPALQKKLSVLKVSRAAAEEQPFIAMLAGPGGLASLPVDQPFAALLFGRGRALGAWPAQDLTNELIEEATLFLFGACSCEIKKLNPGWDLLMNMDWEAELAKAEQTRLALVNDKSPSSATTEKPRTSLMPEIVKIIPQAQVPPPAPARGVSPLVLFLIINGALLVLAILLLLIRKKKS